MGSLPRVSRGGHTLPADLEKRSSSDDDCSCDDTDSSSAHSTESEEVDDPVTSVEATFETIQWIKPKGRSTLVHVLAGPDAEEPDIHSSSLCRPAASFVQGYTQGQGGHHAMIAGEWCKSCIKKVALLKESLAHELQQGRAAIAAPEASEEKPLPELVG